MSVSSSDIEAAAARLWTARINGEACQPVADLLSAGGLDAAYAAQQAQTEKRVASGARLVGRKIGLTSTVVQAQLGVDQPDYGALFDDMAFGDRDELPTARLIQPRIEGEIAFVLERDLDDAASLADVLRAIAYAVPAIEVVDSRVRDWAITAHDTIADNASSGLFVLGATPKRITGLDFPLLGMALEVRGEPLSVGCGAACLGNPVHAVLWLACRMAASGTPLRAGDVILSGALGPMVPVRAGEAYRLRISQLGSVTAAFAPVAQGQQ